MSQTATLTGLRQQIMPQSLPAVNMDMNTVAGFESMQRAAKLFASSSIVPTSYQGEKGLPNCFIAIDMALRMGANPLLVMQNLYIVHGNPAWSAQFLIATFNKCGRFSAIRYEFQGEEGTDSWGCRAVATELATREKLAGPLVTIGLAKKEGWYNKNGSKWQSMPEMMLRYRAAAWFVRAYAPEIAMGLKTAEEEQDSVITVEAGKNGVYEVTLENAAEQQAAPEPGPQAEEKPDKKARRRPKAEPAPEPEPEDAQASRAPEKPVASPQEPPAQAAQSEPPEPEAPGKPAQQRELTYECPRNGRMVAPSDCEACSQKVGCPEYWPQEEQRPPEDEEDF